MKKSLIPVALGMALLITVPAMAREHDDERRAPVPYHQSYGYDEWQEQRGGECTRSSRYHHDTRYGRGHHDHSDYERDYRHGQGFDPAEIRLIINWFGARPYVDLEPAFLPARSMRSVRASYGPWARPARLPHALARRLSPAPLGYERVLVGNDILLIQPGSGAIVDLVHLR